MKTVKTFPKGGLHPRSMKAATRDLPLGNASVPVVSVVPLLQHAGTPAECLVSPGDTVREGMLIGRTSGFISSQVHSPVPGRVREVRSVYLPSGTKAQAVVIDLGGEFDRLGKKAKVYPWENLSKEDLLATIVDKGVVGMGGSSFPAHIKLTIPKGRKAEVLIMNGMECEPYLTADHRIMIEKPAELVEGLKIIARIISAETCMIGLDEGDAEAAEALEKAVIASGFKVEVVGIQAKFPQGDEKQLVKALLGREIPSEGIPLDAGAVVMNVGTVFSLFEAVVLQKPVIERAVTVSGAAIRNPANLKVRIGTPISDLVDECGGFVEIPEKIVVGGPMMGFAVYDMATPVTKTTSGVLFLTSREVNACRRSDCLNCGRCVESCPMGLNPTRLFKWIDHGEYDAAMDEGLLDCQECGCCGYSCPARIPLVQGMRIGKKFGRKRKAGE